MLHWLRRKRLPHDRVPDMYAYRKATEPSAGANDLVFETSLGLPLHSFIGPGVLAGQFNVYQPTQKRVPFQVITGFQAGVDAGTLYSQPLVSLETEYPDESN